eukprot:CAMPEP_0194532578 /NCGR_PEP_ID=MMETSP0253-20130528/70173_1 /TAXON_ID=2966 /ORGANISM="Noctiluca scintillans" /LENGTH=192 /DNA_ID=CAMNT_0039378041 /DNA_START=189 /DNA_END=767 /DNA_ORIENTATION=+
MRKSRVEVNYRAMTLNGTEFDSTYKRGDHPELALVNEKGLIMGASAPPILTTRVIRNLLNIMGDMRQGDMWEIYLPGELGWDDTEIERSGLEGILEPGDCVIFQLDMIKIRGERRRLLKCDMESKEHCLDVELDLLDRLGGKLEESREEVARLEERLFGGKEVLKTTEREDLDVELRFVKRLAKAAKRSSEL